MFNLCLIIAHFNIYTDAKESELCSFLVFQAFLKHKLSIEPSAVHIWHVDLIFVSVF